MPGCKPNDLAVIIKDETEANVGAFVTVVADLGVSKCCDFHGEMRYMLIAPKTGTIIYEGFSIPIDTLEWPDNWLQPIRGLPTGEPASTERPVADAEVLT